MADGVMVNIDTTDLVAALTALGDKAQSYVNAASKETADAIVTEAHARLRRQLGPNATGETEAGLAARPAYDGNGYVVVDENSRMPNLPLWIEKGTKRGDAGSHTAAARPYFYVSAQLEEGAHLQRISDAVQQAIADQGLGG